MSYRSSSRRLSRVSSAATTATDRSTSMARMVTSARLPIGVATTNSRPGARRPSAAGPSDSVTAERWASPARGARPPPRVEVVDARGPRSELRDRWDLALELGGRDQSIDACDDGRLEAERGHLL